MTTQKHDIIIAGAGLTGLTLAYYLKKQGRSPIIIEKADRPGGVIQTRTENGFTFEAGPNTGVLGNKEIALLFEELRDHCTLETGQSGAAKRYVLKNGKWHALPSGLISAVTTPLFTLGDKFRVLGEPFRKPGSNPDESVADMVKRRLGKSFLDYAVDPFISGIYAGDPSRLVTRYALPKLYALEQNYGSFVKGTVKKGKEKKSEEDKKATKEVFSVRGGLGNLIGALEKEVGRERIIYGVRNLETAWTGNGFSVSFAGEPQQLECTTFITTAGGFALPEILTFIAPEELAPVTSLQYAGVAQVAVGYNEWKGFPLDAFGGLVPSLEKRQILGILFPSAIFAGRAPGNGALLSVFLGGTRNRELVRKSDDEITGIALEEIRRTLNDEGQPDLLKVFRYEKAIPQYEASSGERLECIRRLEKNYPGLILAGNIRDGIGMADRVKQAKSIADMLTR
ncbi:MAG: protoporphyrinogen oxidase [Bacteroidota bacterium]|nr:protoporphyrinogen oxidase [Bacteroidota bacterium]